MNFDLTIAESEQTAFQRSLLSDFEKVRPQVQASMGERLLEIVRSNFGAIGVNRPIDWVPLTDPYARKVRRDYATLYVTGALEGAVKLDVDNDRARVGVSDADVPYATIHQYGSPGKMPPRPYFPLVNGELTQFSQEQVTEAGRAELGRLLGGGDW